MPTKSNAVRNPVATKTIWNGDAFPGIVISLCTHLCSPNPLMVSKHLRRLSPASRVQTYKSLVDEKKVIVSLLVHTCNTGGTAVFQYTKLSVAGLDMPSMVGLLNQALAASLSNGRNLP